eukprot:scaffold2477_cov95-Isochrysis_galbana.AAC.7
MSCVACGGSDSGSAPEEGLRAAAMHRNFTRPEGRAAAGDAARSDDSSDSLHLGEKLTAHAHTPLVCPWVHCHAYISTHYAAGCLLPLR